jgi:hypothetical protein
VLRVREGDPAILDHLRTTFTSLFDIYGHEYLFDVSITANVVLEGTVIPRFAVFYGQDFTGRRDYTAGPPETVRTLGDVEGLRTDFTVDDFDNVFRAYFTDSDVKVSEIINIIFIIRRYLPDFTPAAGGQRIIRLF